MKALLQGLTTVLGRIMIAAIFLTSAIGSHLRDFDGVAASMGSRGIPQPQVQLAGAILFLIAGSVSLILGYKARIGAAMLFLFLVPVTYYFHDFWNLRGPDQQSQLVQFLKNLGLMGAMLFIMANGSGPMSLEKSGSKGASAKPKAKPAK
ncbi:MULTISPECIES: DoxX family protein [unclassified Schlesneria]|uniref:DoxX family protein n=1 Tax=unclassified Schlesneria TaxID=2762017 RepID=UPI002F1B435B